MREVCSLKTFLNAVGKIRKLHDERVCPDMSFMELAERFADMPGTVVLASGGDLDCAQYHILAARPWLTLTARPGMTTLNAGDEVFESPEDPLSAIREVLGHFRIEDEKKDLPVSAGLFGYLAYDLKDYIEDLPRTAIDDLCLPIVCLYAPSILVVCEKGGKECHLVIPEFENNGENGVEQIRGYFFSIMNGPARSNKSFYCGSAGFSSPFDRDSYMAAVLKIKEYIAAGDIYQVNLSQRFETEFSGRPYALFSSLFDTAPAPFFSYINAGDHHIISTSMERFLMVRGKIIEARPIKGTRPRGDTPEQDEEMKLALVQSPKEDAELSMIVDLMRNDLGRVCLPGSVRVAEHKRLEKYRNVFHLVSVVKGRLAMDTGLADIVAAAFPGGSITGCPRIRAMEIIDELEPTCRHVYTGSIGYLGFHDTMDLSIAIRTAAVYNGRLYFSVGGGIVYDSDPKAEYEETLHKGRAVMEMFRGRSRPAGPERFVWQNGLLVKEESAFVPVFDKGVSYGYGFFETIRANNGTPELFMAHLARFLKSWEALFEGPVPDLSFETIVSRVLEANGLKSGLAAVKITATFGTSETPPHNRGLWVTADPYTHRLEALKKPGLDIATYPHPRQTPLADYKTLNYLYYFLAGKWAQKNGADEALVLNPDGSLSETNTANILLIRDNRVIRPVSPHVLPGVMEKRVLDILSAMGYAIESKPVAREGLDVSDYAFVLTNSLMGPVPVLSIDGMKTADALRLCRKLQAETGYIPDH